MESLFFKIVCIGFFITCITVFYEEVAEFVQFQAYGNPFWLNVSQECSCDGGKTRNCYPHPDDSQLCGKCFVTCPELMEKEEQTRSDDLVFGLSASMNDVNRLLVLIASIHRNFPTTKLIIFDHANGVFYEEVAEFVQFQAYGNPFWLNVSQECSCDGGKTRNCYPHPDDSQLCGKCFVTCPELMEKEEQTRSDDLVFGLSASMNDVNRLLVLIASIHRNFPTTKLIIFDHANGTALESQLISIRNVEVVNFKNRGNGKAASTPFYLKEILTHHSNVLWLTHDLEILNTKLMQAGPFRRSSKYAITYISHDKRRKVTSSGYRPYFPSSSLMPHFPMAVLLKNDAISLIRWVEKCAETPECWKCDTSSGVIEDCTWMVLHQVASDAKQFRFLGDTAGTINKQTWGPPECDFYCTMWLILVTVVAVVSFGILALVLLKKSTKKTN